MSQFNHSSLTDEHYTPPFICQKASLLMGGIELDACSNAIANSLVQANRFITLPVDGFHKGWKCKSLFLNPPGGINDSKIHYQRWGTRSRSAQWFKRAYHYWHRGIIGQAVFIGFNLSVLRTCPEILTLPFCIPSQRIRFWCTDQQLLAREKAKRSPQIRKTMDYIQQMKEGGESVYTECGSWLLPSRSPMYDNVIVYLPPREPSGVFSRVHAITFDHIFRSVGHTNVNTIWS